MQADAGGPGPRARAGWGGARALGLLLAACAGPGEPPDAAAPTVAGRGAAMAPMLTLAWTADGDQSPELLGLSVASAGDVDGDGYADVVAGAPEHATALGPAGRVLLWRGSADGPGDPAWIVEGSAPAGSFGHSVASAGDVNGDGYDDVVVGAPRDASQGKAEAGAAFLYLGSPTGPSPVPDWSAYGSARNNLFGWTVAAAGDVDGDGYGDVLVGEPEYTRGQTAEGRVLLFAGSPTGLGSVPAWSMEGGVAYAFAGWDVAGGGDLNGDGHADVVVGNPEWASVLRPEGAALVYAGSAAGLPAAPSWIVPGANPFDRFGDGVAFAGDVDGDGFDELLVGAPGWESLAGPVAEGAVFLHHGSAAGPVVPAARRLGSGLPGGDMGDAIAGAGDVDADGYADVLVAVPSWDAGPSGGRLWVYRGSPLGLEAVAAWTVDGDQDGMHLGGALGSAGDVNADGYADIVAGAPYHDSVAHTEGRVLVYTGACYDPADADGDLVGDRCDACGGADDREDGDGDTVPDACDNCPEITHLDQHDGDLDGAGDRCDRCAGSDDALDADLDGAPDACDACAGHPDGYDQDEDGVADGCDTCSEADDRLDADLDGAPDGCDACAGGDDGSDADLDGVPDACELCAGSDDGQDGDADGVPDGCDLCPGDPGGLDLDGDGLAACNGDCWEADPAVHAGAVEVADGVDGDCDRIVDDGTAWWDDDGDGYAEDGGDCDDARADLHPGAPETCDGLDGDCDGSVDEGTECADDDGDGFTELAGDCADADPLVFPGALELLDNRIDDDCDGAVDPGHWDADGDGWEAGDCAPDDAAIAPGRPELANGADDDCDGLVDEGTRAADDDGDGITEDGGDCDDGAGAIFPGAPETADRRDEDCDGLVDEGTAHFDDDGDGQAEIGGDCDDTSAAVFGGALEDVNGVDDDCDGVVDEGTHDVDGDGWTVERGDCDDRSGWANPEEREVCDGIDNDCDDVVDDDCATTVPAVVRAPGAAGGCDHTGSARGGLVGLAAALGWRRSRGRPALTPRGARASG